MVKIPMFVGTKRLISHIDVNMRVLNGIGENQGAKIREKKC